MSGCPLPAGLPPLTVRGLRDLIYGAPRACRQEPGFFTGSDAEEPGARERRVGIARTICADCPVRLACLAYALRTRASAGVWGGLDADAGELGYLTAAFRVTAKTRAGADLREVPA